MTARPGIGVLLLPGLALAVLPFAGAARGACLTLASHPDGKPLAQVGVRDATPTFAITYVHSVTRTPVDERYRIDGGAIVQDEIRFRQHGPGLPTEADAGGAWRREGATYVVSMRRRFDTFAMRVHADQSPRLAVTGDPRPVNLAQWGNRALSLEARAGECLVRPGQGGFGVR
ncbi:hypothetical protein BURK1_01166 [Burkholderiales bacterium]|nr:hypothetical protein BURK1_01166 [Burkholderiales bacterium]